MVQICAVASGSNGNCYYIGNGDNAILVDAGISRRQILKKFRQKRLNINNVKAVFISHEHSDHMRGVRVLSDMHSIPVYFTEPTFQWAKPKDRPGNVNFFSPGSSVQIGDITVHSFSKNHDAVDPVSFRITVNGKNIGVFTDIGDPCNNVKEHLAVCDAAFLETNYDEDLLWAGPYPHYLKTRVSSDIGHLSNIQAVELVKSLKDKKLKHIFLSHISAENNRIEFARDAFDGLKKEMNIIPTSRYEPSDILEL